MLPTDTKEAISWGAQWEWGSYKHPPLAAFLAYSFFRIFLCHDIGLYILAQLCLICGAWFIFLQARAFFGERRAALAALALYFLHYFNPSQMNFNPNYVEIALLPIVTFCFWRAVERPAWWRWLPVGVFGALSVLGKYSGGIVLFTLFLIMLAKKEYRRQIFSIGPYLALIVFIGLLLPHIKWLIRHDFCTLTYVDDSVARKVENFSLVLEVLGTALYPFAMAIAAIFIASLPRRKWKRVCAVKKFPFLWGVSLCFVPALIFIGIAACGGTVVAAWFFSLTSWSTIAVVAAWPWYLSKQVFRRFYLFLIAYTLVMIIGVMVDTNCKARLRLHATPEALKSAIDPVWCRYSDQPIKAVIGHWEITYAFELYFPNHPPATTAEDFLSFENLRPVADREGALLIEKSQKVAQEFIRKNCDPARPVKLERVILKFHARWGKECQQIFWIAYLPPGVLVKNENSPSK